MAERKINLVGANTLTVALPANFVKKFEIQKGDIVDIKAENNRLIIQPKNNIKLIKESHIDVSGLDNMIHRIIVSCHKAGYDEFIVKFANQNELKSITHAIGRSCIGFDTIKLGNNKIKVCEITKCNDEEFENIFRKSIQLLKVTGNELIEALNEMNIEKLDYLVEADQFMDKYTNFCKRLISKGYKSEKMESIYLFSILEDLEMIGDGYKDIAKVVAENAIKPNKEVMALIEKTNNLIQILEKLIIQPDYKLIKSYGQAYKELKEDFKKIKYSEQQAPIIFEVKHLFKMAFDVKGALLQGCLPKL